MASKDPSTMSPGPQATEDLGIVDGLIQLSFLVQGVLGRAVAVQGLSTIQARLLGTLRDREPGMAQLARLLQLDKSSMTGLVDRAEQRGLVRRVAVPEDGRAVHVTLTSKGRRLAETLTAEVGRQLTGITDDLGVTDRGRLSLLASQLVLRDGAARGLDLSTSATRPPAEQGNLGTNTPAGSRRVQGGDVNERVAVVVGSTRPTRICRGIAEWVLGKAQEASLLHYELLDLAEIDLPFLDEPLKGALGHYEHEHTKAWSRTVSSYGGFVFVFPQYNWGYPAPLKNALDFLYLEWSGKPASCVTYGTRGGGKGALQFHGVLQGLHMRELEDHLEVVITDDDVDGNWQLKDLDATLSPYAAQISAIDAQMIEALKDSQ